MISRRWQDQAQKDRRSSLHLVRVACGDPWSKRDKSPTKSACDYPLSSTKTSEETSWVLRSLFPRPMMFLPFCYSLFSCMWLNSSTLVRLQRRSGTAKKSSHPWHFRCWSSSRNGNNLECTNLVHWTEALHRFSSRDAIIACWFCVRKALWWWFYPRSRKRNHCQTLATRVPKLKTLLGTQRVKIKQNLGKNSECTVAASTSRVFRLCLTWFDQIDLIWFV